MMHDSAPNYEETILVQYRDFESDHEFSDPDAVTEALLEWLDDPERSAHFNVRVHRRLIQKRRTSE